MLNQPVKNTPRNLEIFLYSIRFETYKYVAKYFKISPSRVQQINQKFIRQLTHLEPQTKDLFLTQPTKKVIKEHSDLIFHILEKHQKNGNLIIRENAYSSRLTG